MQYLSFLFGLGMIFSGGLVSAEGSHSHSLPHSIKNEAINDDIKLSLENEPKQIMAHKLTTIRFKLLQGNKVLAADELKEVHTKKIHILIIDSSLNDYHHIHPIEEGKQGYTFSFIPKSDASYQMWVDITLRQTNKQFFLEKNLGMASEVSQVKEITTLKTRLSSYEFTLKLDDEPKASQAVMASISISKNGKPFTKLEPVMGAFAHIVGFSGDHASVIHIHPLGKEPSSELERGGSKLRFHIELKQAGFVKLFAQFRINGQDVYVPFGFIVKQ